MHVITANTVGIQAKRCNDGHHESFCTEETHWGYIIWSTSDTSDGLTLTTSLSLLAGAALFAAALGMWLMLGMSFGADVLMKRLFAKVAFLPASSRLLCYASRGIVSEI